MATVVIIGAGMGGMATAARLAAKGHTVNVYEHSDTWGGKLGHVSHGEHKFDTGPSLLTLPAVYRDLFLKTGRAIEDSIEIVDLDTAFRYQFADGTVLKMPGTGIGSCAEAIGDALGGNSADEWRAFMARAAKMWAATRRPFLESPLNGMKSLLKLSWRVNDLVTISPGRTLRSLSEHYFSDPRLVTLVDRYATYTGSDPRQAPAALATVPYIEQTFGAYHVAGGLRELGRALFERCTEIGVNFHFNQTVEKITTNERVTGIELANGTHVPADIVVANCDAAQVYSSLLNDTALDASSRDVHRLQRATPSLSGFVVLAALDGVNDELEHHNVFFPADYDNEFDSIFGTSSSPRPVPDPTIYICSPKDTAMAPENTESWFVLVNAPRHDVDHGVNWTKEHAHYSELVLDSIERRLPGSRARMTWHESISPADLEGRTMAPGGAIYGSSSNGAMSAFLRPRNVTAIKNLYLVGGSSHPGGGLPLVGMSAEIVATHIGRA